MIPMGGRFSSQGVAACLVAGFALWFTRASLDVAGGPRGEVRIAMFPSWAELVGLVILAAVVVLLGSMRLTRTLRARVSRRTLPAAPLIPLFSLAWLAVPYLPWLPDAVPALRVFAGPARFAFWAIVLGQMAWVTWQLARPETDAATPSVERIARQSAVVLVVSAVALGTAGVLLTSGPLYPGGDEPHYLVTTQSLLGDGDLRIENNHDRGDYREYFGAPLKPDYTGRGRDGAVYSIHPVGLPVLIAPAFALGGYPAVVACLVLIGTIGAAVSWRWAEGRTGSATSATVGWLAVAGSASFVLHSVAVYPEIIAAAVVVAAFAGARFANRLRLVTPLSLGLLAGALPWLSTMYAPMSAALALVLAARQPTRRTAGAVIAPYAISVVLWLAFFQYLWGSPLPTAPDGGAHQTALANILVGAPALLLDQEYGLLPYAPALLLAFPGLWQMWRAEGAARREAGEIVLVAGALMLTMSAYLMWWGGSSAPGGQLVPILPLLVLPIAWWDARAASHALLSAAGRLLVLVNLAVTATLVGVRSGGLAVNRRDGSSQLLEWLAPSNDLVRILPSFIAYRDALATPLVVTVVWVLAALGVGTLLLRLRPSAPANAPSMALTGLVATVVLAAIAVPATLGKRIPSRADPAAQAESAMLSTFDARARPSAVVYDVWHRVPADEVPPLFTFRGRPGLRRDPQPVRVLLNTRLALPAGQYAVEIVPVAGAGLDGAVALQLGRTGRPFREWVARTAPGERWSRDFRVDVDTPFVGFRTSPALERAVGEVVVRPRSVVNAAERLDRYFELPPVLAAAQYGELAIYFHESGAYPEREGFWVRGATELITTFALPPASGRSRVRLKLHTGAAANRVAFRSGAWRTAIELQPKEAGEVEIPILASTGQAVVRITTATGFVPARTTGGSDRRLLGCWIEVVE